MCCSPSPQSPVSRQSGGSAIQAYLEHTRTADIEHQQGVEEYQRQQAEQSMDDVIDGLEQTPAFNGPGAPTLGLGPDTTQP